MGNCYFASRSEALVVSGGCCVSKTEKKRAVAGNRKCIWTWAGMSKVERLCMEVMNFQWTFENVKTAEGTAIDVPVTVIVQVMEDFVHLHKAIEHFLGKSREEIGQIIIPVVDTHLRLVYDGERLEDVETALERDTYFSAKIQRSVAPELWDMGILVHKFVIDDIRKAGDGHQVNGNIDVKLDQRSERLC